MPSSPSTGNTGSTVDSEKLASLTWSLLPPMKTHREGGAAVAVGTEMVAVMGGYHSERKFLNSCAALFHGQWKPLPDMISPRMGCGACSVGRKVIVAEAFIKGERIWVPWKCWIHNRPIPNGSSYHP